MPRFDLPPVALRLDRIMRDLGYLHKSGGDHADRGRAYRVIDRRTRIMGTLTERRFVDLCRGRGPELTAAEAVIVADGLGFDVRRLLYQEDSIPRRPDRPELLLDELDMFGSPY